MNETDQQFVNTVTRWRNGRNNNLIDDLKFLIEELDQAVDEYKYDYDDEDTSMWDIGFDDGYNSAIILVKQKLERILNAERD